MRFPAVVAVALAVAPAASARTLTLNWVEKISPAYGYPAMTFTVKTFTVNGASWSVKGSVANRSRGDVKIRLRGTPYGGPYAEYTFGVFIPSPCTKPGNVECSDHSYATKWSPRVPSVLHPGQRWSGTFSGTKKLPRGKLLSIMFGYFASSVPKKDFAYVTQHEFKL